MLKYPKYLLKTLKKFTFSSYRLDRILSKGWPLKRKLFVYSIKIKFTGLLINKKFYFWKGYPEKLLFVTCLSLLSLPYILESDGPLETTDCVPPWLSSQKENTKHSLIQWLTIIANTYINLIIANAIWKDPCVTKAKNKSYWKCI